MKIITLLSSEWSIFFLNESLQNLQLRFYFVIKTKIKQKFAKISYIRKNSLKNIVLIYTSCDAIVIYIKKFLVIRFVSNH